MYEMVTVLTFENFYKWLLSRVLAQDSREAACGAMLEKTSTKAYVTMLLKPVFTEWKDVMSDACARRMTLHSLLTSIMGGWHRYRCLRHVSYMYESCLLYV